MLLLKNLIDNKINRIETSKQIFVSAIQMIRTKAKIKKYEFLSNITLPC